MPVLEKPLILITEVTKVFEQPTIIPIKTTPTPIQIPLILSWYGLIYVHSQCFKIWSKNVSILQGFSDLNEDDDAKSEDNSSDCEDAIAVDKSGPRTETLVDTN